MKTPARTAELAARLFIGVLAGALLLVPNAGRAQNDTPQSEPGQEKPKDDEAAEADRLMREMGNQTPLHDRNRKPVEPATEPPPTPPGIKFPKPEDGPISVDLKTPKLEAEQIPQILKVVLEPAALEQIAKGDLRAVVGRVREQLDEAARREIISKEVAQTLKQATEELGRLRDAGPPRSGTDLLASLAEEMKAARIAQEKLTARRRDQRIFLNTPKLLEQLRDESAGDIKSLTKSASQQDITPILAREAFGFYASQRKDRPPLNEDDRPLGSAIFSTPDSAASPRLQPGLSVSRHIKEPPSPAAASSAPVPAFRPKGVMIHIDEGLLAQVIGGQSLDATTKEVLALEDGILKASDGVEVFRQLREFIETKKHAFLQKHQQSQKIAQPRLVSLRKLLTQLETYRDRWDKRPADLQTAGGLTRIHGYLREQNGDLLLVGRAEPGAPAISVDDLIVGLRTVWGQGRTPGCSLDPRPDNIRGPQFSRILGVPGDSSFAKVMLDADYRMKRIMAGVEGEKLGIPGYRTLADCAFALGQAGLGAKSSRFWLFPVQPNAREIQVGLGGTAAFFDARVQVLTEAMALTECGLEGMGRPHPSHQMAAESFTEHYDAIAALRSEFKQLRGLFDIVLLGRILRLTAPTDAFLKRWCDLPYTSVKVQESYAGVEVVHRHGNMVLTLTGGCDIRARAHFRHLFDAATPTLANLAGAASKAAQAGALSSDVPGVTIALPVLSTPGTDPAMQAYDRGLRALAEGNLSSADEQFTEAIESDESFADAYAKRAVVRFLAGQRRKALRDAAKALELAPRDPAVQTVVQRVLLDFTTPAAPGAEIPVTADQVASLYYDRAMAKLQKPDFKGAVKDLDVVVKLRPRWHPGYTSRGMAKLPLGDKKGAKADCDKALSLNPNDVVAYWVRGSARSSLNDSAGAIKDFDEVIRRDGKNASALYNRAIAKRGTEDHAGWAADILAAFNLDPRMEILPDVKEMLADCDRLLKKDAKSVNGHLLRGIYLRRGGDFKGARAAYQQVLLLDFNSIEGLKRYADLLLAQKEDLVSADGFLTMALTREKKRADLYYLRGTVLRERATQISQSGDRKQVNVMVHLLVRAEQDFTRVIELEPTNFNAYLFRSNARAVTGKMAEAVQDIDRCLAMEPGKADLYKIRGVLLVGAGRRREAIRDLEKAIQLDGGLRQEVEPMLRRLRQKK
jgi:tetratricopeptide (TPR) repeat protein